jgi:hypothetical protein
MEILANRIEKIREDLSAHLGGAKKVKGFVPPNPFQDTESNCQISEKDDGGLAIAYSTGSSLGNHIEISPEGKITGSWESSEDSGRGI